MIEGFTKDLDEIIHARVSWRDYKPVELSKEDIEKIDSILGEISQKKGPFGGQARFKLITLFDKPKEEAKQLGTYGMVRGAKYFLVGAIPRGNLNYEDYGFLFERVILRCTELGLGTCWLGGTFNKSAFSDAISLAEQEDLPAVSPIGYTKGSHGLIGGIFRLAIKAHKRNAWFEMYYDGNFAKPLTEELCPPEYRQALEWVRVAPSARNKQPWRILVDENSVHFFIKAESVENGKPKIMNFQRLDLGIAMSHFELGVKLKQIAGKWSVLSDLNIKGPTDLKYMVSWIKQ
jgi:nitroreductase